MKICKTCGVLKGLDQFAKARTPKGLRPLRGGDGRTVHCKYCVAEKRAPGIHARREAEDAQRKKLFTEGLKFCTKCEKIKSISEFCVRKASPDGLNLKCRDCSRVYLEAWREKNPDSFKEYYAENSDALRARSTEWRIENSDYRAAYMAKWAIDNRGLVNEKNAYRNAIKRRATVAWADRAKIREIYAECARISEETGVPHEVDHIYPLQSKQVCGLHCEANLKVITQFENIQKLNRMPTEEYLQRCKR